MSNKIYECIAIMIDKAWNILYNLFTVNAIDILENIYFGGKCDGFERY